MLSLVTSLRASMPGQRAPVRGRVRVVKHRITGRERLALERLPKWLKGGGNFLVVLSAMRISRRFP